MSPQPPATLIDAELDDQWRSIDRVLGSLAQRSRARSESDELEEMEEPAVRTATRSLQTKGALQRRLQEVTLERDELRVRLAAAERRLRSVHARLERLEQPRDHDRAGGARPDAARSTRATTWLRMVRQLLRRHQ